MELKDRFEDAQKRVKTLPKAPGVDVLLKLYALFKQGNEGDVSGKRPGLIDIKGKAKYDAWAGLKGMKRDAAMEAYVKLVEELLAKAK
jgi:acyl-CoA-binding protein